VRSVTRLVALMPRCLELVVKYIFVVIFLLCVEEWLAFQDAFSLELCLKNVVHFSVVLHTGQELLNRVVLVKSAI